MFLNRERTQMKVLYFDRSGYCPRSGASIPCSMTLLCIYCIPDIDALCSVLGMRNARARRLSGIGNAWLCF
jgi:hypothetical protein